MRTTHLDACVVRFVDDGTFKVGTPQALVVGPGPLALARGTANALCPALYTMHVNPLDSVGVDYYPQTAPPCQIQSTPAAAFLAPGQVPTGHIPLVPKP